LYRILAVLGLGLVPTDRAWAQDTPAKAEVPRESAPPEASSEALSMGYRFSEKYSLNEDPQKPELVSQYQVGMIGTYKTVTEKPQGVLDRSESTSQIIYTERPAKVSKFGEVIVAVRRFDYFSRKPILPAKPLWFEGLTIWYLRRPGLEPVILSLTNDRQLRELEYDQITKQVFLPQLMTIIPPTPIRVGDTWHIPPNAARNLLGETPDPKDYILDGTLIEVRKTAKGTALIAKIGIRGEFDLSESQCAVGAQIQFMFEPEGAALTPVGTGTSPKSVESGAKPVKRIVDARGWVSEVRMTQKAVYPIPESDGRLNGTTTFELILERKRPPSAPNAAGGAKDAPLFVPDPAPTADEDNSWIVYEDSKKRFHFRHPQQLRLGPKEMGPDVVELIDRQFRGYSLIFQILPKETNPERERENRDPDYHRRTLFSLWEKQHWDVVAGPTGWLPEADWLPLKRKVYRIEAATKPPGAAANAQRQYRDYYLVLFTTTNQTMVVWAITDEDHLNFRDQVEAVIKTFQFGPSEGRPNSPAVTPTPAPAPPEGQPKSPAATPTPAPKPPL